MVPGDSPGCPINFPAADESRPGLLVYSGACVVRCRRTSYRWKVRKHLIIVRLGSGLGRTSFLFVANIADGRQTAHRKNPLLFFLFAKTEIVY